MITLYTEKPKNNLCKDNSKVSIPNVHQCSIRKKFELVFALFIFKMLTF